MDAPLTLKGLMEELAALLEGGDFPGAEELLARALSAMPVQYEPFLHLQFGRLYARWNKLTSALNHFGRAAELARDEMLLVQIVEEIRAAKHRQAEQAP